MRWEELDKYAINVTSHWADHSHSVYNRKVCCQEFKVNTQYLTSKQGKTQNNTMVSGFPFDFTM